MAIYPALSSQLPPIMEPTHLVSKSAQYIRILHRLFAPLQVARFMLGLDPALALAADLDRRTPLELAVRAGHDAVADLLFAAGEHVKRA